MSTELGPEATAPRRKYDNYPPYDCLDEELCGYGETCQRGHKKVDHNVIRDWPYATCRTCSGVARVMRQRRRKPTNPGNPWSGELACPVCASDDWTLPLDGRWACETWRCMACHVEWERPAS